MALSLLGPGSFPGWGTKILQAAQRGKKKKKTYIFKRWQEKKKMYIFKRRYGMEREYRLNGSIFSTQSPLDVSREIP